MGLGTAISSEEKVTIQRAYRRLQRSIKTPLDDTDRRQIREAYELAVEAHKRQRRKSGEPYVLHPIEVARICAKEIGLGPTAIICAILHDVVEDTEVTLQEIFDQFGPKIGKIVDGLTKLDGTYNTNSPQAENFKKVLSTLVEDVRVVLIKMADRLHNLRTIGVMPKHKQLRIAAETEYIYAPLAHRLGLYNFKTEFQDLCMRITDAETYEDIQRKLKDSKRERSRYINEFIKPLRTKFDNLNIPYRIHGRPKSVHSIWNKIRTKKVDFEEIYDLFAIRIILDVPIEREKYYCWQVYSIVTDVHRPIPERLKDWITTPKSNGYESLHTTVVGPKGRYVEVQIRTDRMDEIAERGYAAHYKYKGADKTAQVYDHFLENVRDILDNNENSDAIEFLSDFKTNLFKEEVYVYTPNGDMIVLPKGATALDFAFAIHTDIGYHCTAIKVNNKLVPMGYKLRNGDQLQVMTQKSQSPNDDWLKMVVTGKARSKIRSALKEERRQQGIFGKEAIERKCNHLKLDFDETVDFLVKHFQFKNRPDLYYAISIDEINLTETLKQFEIVDHKLTQPKPKRKKEPQKEEEEPKRRRGSRASDKTQILVNDEPGDQYNFSFANCCKPVPGDDIFAYLTATSGMKIHRINCPNATNLMARYGYRIMKAEWANIGTSSFVVDLQITGVDKGIGVIEQITKEISTKLNLNIRSFSIEGNEGFFEGRVSLYVLNTDQVNQVIKAIKNLDGISNVIRIE